MARSYISSFTRPESSGFIYMLLGFVRYANNLIAWIPACAGMTDYKATHCSSC
jgi:hypothetical protein